MMIEWAAHVSNTETIKHLDSLFDVPIDESGLPILHRLTCQLIHEHFGNITVSRIYLGNEFCQHLIPSLSTLRTAYHEAKNRSLAFSLVTPYVGDEGLRKVGPLFEFLQAQSEPSEVIFNDWGVLHRLRDFPQLKPVQGRLLDKMLRDPRITPFYRDAPVSIRGAMQRSNATASPYVDFLARQRVELVELDNVMQGLNVNFQPLSVGAAVYLPYGFVATGRVCMIASLHQPARERFRPEIQCHHECQQYVTVYTYTSSPFGNKDQRFYLKGNTHFYTHTEEMLRFILSQAESLGIRRLIYQPSLPMWVS